MQSLLRGVLPTTWSSRRPTGRAKGKQAIVKVWGDIYKEPTMHKCTVNGARAEGDGAWAYGEVTITGNPAGHISWAGFEIKQSGQWKVQLLHVAAVAKE